MRSQHRDRSLHLRHSPSEFLKEPDRDRGEALLQIERPNSSGAVGALDRQFGGSLGRERAGRQSAHERRESEHVRPHTGSPRPSASGPTPATDHRASIARLASRSCWRRLRSSRLSYSFFPRASAKATLA